MIVFDLMAFSWGFNGVLMVCASSSDCQQNCCLLLLNGPQGTFWENTTQIQIFQLKFYNSGLQRTTGGHICFDLIMVMSSKQEASIQILERLASSGLILGFRPANERCRYKVTPSLIGWAKPRISHCIMHCTNKLPLGQLVFTHWGAGRNGRHFADNIFKYMSLKGNFCFFIIIALKYVPKGQTDNKSALIYVMAYRLTGAKPLQSCLEMYIRVYASAGPLFTKW